MILGQSPIQRLRTRTLAVELANNHVRVNAVGPGYTNTDILKNVGASDPATFQSWKDQSPRKRILEPDEIGRVVAFLASDAASAITGQTIMADAGYSIW